MEEPQQTVDALKSIINKAQAPARVEKDGVPFLILSSDERAQGIENLLPQPVRKTGKPTFKRVDSFCAYINEHRGAGTHVYAVSVTNFAAVMNGHEADGAGWGDHVAYLGLTATPEWLVWFGQNGRPLPQREFACFLEDNADDIMVPTGAEMLDLVRIFQATQSAEFKSVVGEKPGNNTLEYTQTIKSNVGTKGDIELPESFTLKLSPYEGGALAELRARLRFKIDQGRLSLWYDLFRVQKFIDMAVKEIAEQITKETTIPVWYGTP